MKACSFFGHRDAVITNELKVALNKEIIRLIAEGFDCFYFGGFGTFDHLCWQLVTELKNTFINIRRIYCLSDPRHLRTINRPKYLKDEHYEEFVYLDMEFDYWYTKIYYRNCTMISQSDFVIFYAFDNHDSGAYKAYKFALQKKKACINFATIP